ncbi:MAG: glycosyltransferase [Candidatus Hodarchaeota archaeon]
MIESILLISPVDPFESTETPRITHYSELYLRNYCKNLDVFKYRKSTFSSKLHLAKFYIPGFLSWDIKRVNQRLNDLVSSKRFDLILIFKAENIFPETIRKIREKSGAVIASWMADDPFCFENIKNSLIYYDYYFIWDSWYINSLRRAGVRDVIHLPLYTIPEVYKKVNLPEEERERLGTDLVFVGEWRPDRENILSQLIDFDIKIYGIGWLKNSKIPKRHLNEEVSIFEINKIYNASKIVLNVHHQWGKNDANFRTFEAMGSGGFLIDERKKDIVSMFKEDEEVVLYHGIEELRAKIRYYLKHEDERRRIAHAGSEVANREHTLTKRYQQLFDYIGFS